MQVSSGKLWSFPGPKANSCFKGAAFAGKNLWAALCRGLYSITFVALTFSVAQKNTVIVQSYLEKKVNVRK